VVSIGPIGGNGAFDVATRLSRSPDGSQRFFETAEALVAEDQDQATDVYMTDGTTLTLISTIAGGGNGNFGAGSAGSSLGGTRVFFETAEALVPEDVNFTTDVYERAGGQTTLITAGPPGAKCFSGFSPVLCPAHMDGASMDGTHVFFNTGLRIAATDNANNRDIYERFGGATRQVNTGTMSDPRINEDPRFLGASADGGRAFFLTRERLLGEDDDQDRCFTDFGSIPRPCLDIYERVGDETRLVSTRAAAGTAAHADAVWGFFATSQDGHHVFFTTAERLVPEDTDAFWDIYERAGGETRLVSTGPTDSNGPNHASLGLPFNSAVSDDGSRAFFTTAEPLVAEDRDHSSDAYMRSGGTTTLISTGPSDRGADESSGFSAASPDGEHVFFTSAARLTSEDTDNLRDMYERFRGETRLVSIGPEGGNSSCEGFESPIMCEPVGVGLSSGGTRALFSTFESLVAADTDKQADVYMRFAGETLLLTHGAVGGNGPYFAGGVVSAAGRRVFFTTPERLSARDQDNAVDVYMTIANLPPRCSEVVVDRPTLPDVNHRLRRVTLNGGSEPDGDAFSIEITGVSQDEPVDGTGDGSTSPDAVLSSDPSAVELRGEASGRGDGRVYRIAFTAGDSLGARCSGIVKVSVPRSQRPAVDSAPPSFDSLAP
jgi:hypothetical protein